MQKPPKDKVCAEFCARFPSYRTDIHNKERVEFMLNHPLIRSKLNEWIGTDNKSPLMPNGAKKKTNVNNQFIDTDGIDNPAQITTTTTTTHHSNQQHLKNQSQSTVKRELGNDLFQQKKLLESLQAYNEAIRYASGPSTYALDDNEICKSTTTETENQEFLALAIANRSAVYFELGENLYEKSLMDIELALKYGYPDRLKSKLLLRKANIYVKTKKWSRAESIVNEIRKYHHNSTHQLLHPDKVQELHDMIQRQKNDNQGIIGDEVKVDATQLNDTFEDNPNFENASAGVTLTYSENAQRCVVASTDLKKRSVLFKEIPFASVLLPQFYESHCHNCHKILEHSHFIPCRQCTQCKFCSETCAHYAWNVYHKYECLSLDLLHSVGIAHLAIRILFCAGLQNILTAIQNTDKLTDPKNTYIFRKGCSNYERVYSLLDHVRDMNPEDMFQYTLTAGLLTNWIVNKTSFFEECCPNGNYTGTQVNVGSCILLHICQLICNAHAITDILSDINVSKVSFSTADESQQRIATAIFPTSSMMNHSCDPNIVFTFKEGRTLLVKLTKDVPAGQEIFNCYGAHYRRMSVSSRLESLNDQYFFQCKCHYCTEESAKSISFVDTFTSFKCEACEGPVISPPSDADGETEVLISSCQLCGHQMDLNDQVLACVYTDRLVQDGEVLLERGNVNQALAVFHTCEEQYRGYLYKYHSSLGQLSDVIGRCYAILGEFSKAAKSVKKSLIYVEKRFGPESVEYGREVKKYVDLVEKAEVVVDTDELNRFSELYKSILLE